MDTETIYLLLAIAGGFFGLVKYIEYREKKQVENIKSYEKLAIEFANFSGRLEGKMDIALGVVKRVESLEERVTEHDKKIAVIEQTDLAVHVRLDAAKIPPAHEARKDGK